MAKVWTKTEAFAHFGATMTNVQWSWSARTPDGKTVVLSLWGDRFSWKKRPIEYHEREDDPPPEWIARLGNRERLENLIWAQEHCGRVFRVIMARAKDKNAEPREIEECFPRADLVMRITYIKPTGQFGAMVIDRPEVAS
jgi:hypothetical protein